MSSNVVEYYTNSFNEHKRHIDGFGQIQQLRTLQLFQQYLPTKQRIIDIGGATGVYSFDLAKRGHEVQLLDIVPLHIEKAKQLSEENGVELGGYHVGDAQELSFPDESFDAVILHGPLYHITDIAIRRKVLAEAFRILKPDGQVFAFAINRYAGLFYGVHSELILDDSYFKMVSEEVKTGVRSREPSWYFHLPSELETEVSEAGFSTVETKGVVSPIWMLSDIEKKLSNEEVRQKILKASKLAEDEPILGQDFVTIGVKA
ncbi:class I SAM-dependent methyltransferase [Vibrio sp. SCSIO 43137]|uniref:class I SAM-dependent methyltransferase n=1 Tax=Vibrio sp. SCSIO 43137 TaxID=3021011 RepID=UPI002307CCA8|nr:class I SAM-dependent methyltransferase [Vibrio sp. SCSIO 43137]WCE32286.1 class I SAM-dependent methyltransferase [Vibrio sp. SCSIO 43137]